MKHPFRIAADRLGLALSDDAIRRLHELERLLGERAVPAGFIAAADADRLAKRHVADSLRAAVAVEPSDRAAYDLGSGAGLPGLVVAIAAPHVELRLVETRRARVSFLELAIEHLNLANAVVRHGRAEEEHEPVDLCFARAFAPIDRAWKVARPLLRPGGRLVYFAGAGTSVPPRLHGATSITSLPDPLLASAGSLTIMTR